MRGGGVGAGVLTHENLVFSNLFIESNNKLY